MSNHLKNLLKRRELLVFAALLILVAFLTFITFNNQSVDPDNHLLMYLVENHMAIMAILMIVSIGFGYFLSTIFYKELRKKDSTTKSIMEVVMMFLGSDERKIINYLVTKGGKTNQAEISRLHGMNKVKAHRSLAKMKEKNIIDIIPHGKVRYVHLKQNILDTLQPKL